MTYEQTTRGGKRRESRPIVMLEAPPALGRGGHIESQTITNFYDAIKMSVAFDTGISELHNWFEFRNVTDIPLPDNNKHIDWSGRPELDKAIVDKCSELDGRWVIFANRPWQLLKANYALQTDDIEFCRFRNITLRHESHEDVHIRAAWIWHTANTVRRLWEPDIARIGKFLWFDCVEAWRKAKGRV